MNKHQSKEILEKTKVRAEETTGKRVANEKLEPEGKVDKAAGTLQTKVGDLRNAAKSAVKKP